MRRIVLMVALLAPLASLVTSSAHSCASPAQIEPGRVATVNVGVPAEEAAVVEVEVTVPSGFDLDRVDEALGWTSTREGGVVRFSAGRIPIFGCGYFSLRGTAPKRATLVFTFKVRTDQGAVREYTSRAPGAADAAQLVYAGTQPEDGGGGSSGTNAGQAIVVVALVAAGIAAAGWALRHDRPSPTRRRPNRARPPAGRARGRPRRPGSGSSRRGNRKRQRARRR